MVCPCFLIAAGLRAGRHGVKVEPPGWRNDLHAGLSGPDHRAARKPPPGGGQVIGCTFSDRRSADAVDMLFGFPSAPGAQALAVAL